MRRLVLAACLLLAGRAAWALEPLPALGAARSDVTVSGVSSGGYMAVQLHVAHSEIVSGAGVIAGGPYYCAQASLWRAYNHCMTPGAWTPLPSVPVLKQHADRLAREGRIGPTKNLASAKVWLFTGTEDRTVLPEVVKALQRFYEHYQLAAARLALVEDQPAGHGMVTRGTGNPCAATAPPFINDCGYDAAGEMLAHLLGPLAPPPARPRGRLLEFDQQRFAGGDAHAISMGATGYLYVPRECESVRCRVHVAFHGCRQSAAAVGERFVREAGYNPWADGNRLIVLYPQAVARNGWSFSSWNFVWNPRGCWDWWGYTGAQYHTRPGAQIAAVKAMLDRLASAAR
jgi:poly(3-hydroxybutyrate) depolymerase